MQNKTIRLKLQNKIEDWLDSIDEGHDDLKVLIKKNVIVTGGSIVSMIMGDPINDYDVYFRDKETTIAVAKYYVEKFLEVNKEWSDSNIKVLEETRENINGESENRVCVYVSSFGVAKSDDGPATEDDDAYELQSDDKPEIEEDDGKPKFRPIFLSSNAITLSNKLQLVIRFYGEPDQIHKNYDFVHAKSYYDYHKNLLVTPENALRSMQSKVLKYEGSLYPICSMFRLRKFIGRGWRISAGDILKMAIQIRKIDFQNLKQVEDQLVGCDALYFHHFMAAIQQADQSKLEDECYLFEIINRIFNDD